jgi:hypothetical protein
MRETRAPKAAAYSGRDRQSFRVDDASKLLFHHQAGHRLLCILFLLPVQTVASLRRRPEERARQGSMRIALSSPGTLHQSVMMAITTGCDN